MDDIYLNKAQVIENCLLRIRTKYKGNEEKLKDDFDLQDIIVINLHRTCQASIDIANRIIKMKNLGFAQSSKNAFSLLYKEKIISKSCLENMQNMVGFRNITVHEYAELDMAILQDILENHLQDFEEFSQVAFSFFKKESGI